MLLREYADRTDQEIAELFGADFVTALRDIETGDWQGPIVSAHGAHLVRCWVWGRRGRPRSTMSGSGSSRICWEARRREQNRTALRTLRERYDVRMPGPEPLGETTCCSASSTCCSDSITSCSSSACSSSCTGPCSSCRWVTAFTAAHSITLALSTLGVLTLSQRPVEAVIALSILFLAVELVRGARGERSAMARAP